VLKWPNRKTVKSLKNVNFKIKPSKRGCSHDFSAFLLTLEIWGAFLKNEGVFTIFSAFLFTLENRGVFLKKLAVFTRGLLSS
jgi:hypothetical protein